MIYSPLVRAIALESKHIQFVFNYDMTRNVWEWCLDKYNAHFYFVSERRNPFSGANDVDWVITNFTNIKSSRVLRGGSWLYSAQDVRAAERNWDAPSVADTFSGFRCVTAVTP